MNHYYNEQGEATSPKDAAIRLHKRKDASTGSWYCDLRVKHPLKAGYRTFRKISLGTTVLKEAVQNAKQRHQLKGLDLLNGIEYRTNKRFKHLCDEWIDNQRKQLLVDR